MATETTKNNAVTSTILNIEPIDLEYCGSEEGLTEGEVAVVTGGAGNVELGLCPCHRLGRRQGRHRGPERGVGRRRSVS